MKKIICLLLFSLMIALYGCGQSEDVSRSSAVEEAAFDYTRVDMESVDSSAISEIGYDETHNVLLIRFKTSGKLYQYNDVPYDEYENLIHADSIGSHFNKEIKGQYPYGRIEAGDKPPEEQTRSTRAASKESYNRNQSQQYVLNKKSKKFHKPSCGSVSNMKESNKEYRTDTAPNIERDGYTPCGNCNP